MNYPGNMKLFVWSEDYKADMGKHIFPTEKYALMKKKALKDKIAAENEFIEPEIPSDKEIEIVHTKKHIEKLKRLSSSPQGMLNGENPINESIYKGAKLSCDGTYKACLLALKNGIGMNLAGGFHHAFPDHEEGFCYFHDIGYAIKKLLKEGKIKKAMVIDCDVHQGNGTAFIFKDNPNVFTFSIHQEDNYPVKQKSNYDIGLYSHENIDDKRYLEELKILPKLISDFKPDLIIYEAGADPYENDQLGAFGLTKQGLMKRDEYVIGLAGKNNIPVAIVLGGGYAYKIEDTVKIHVNTMKVVKNL